MPTHGGSPQTTPAARIFPAYLLVASLALIACAAWPDAQGLRNVQEGLRALVSQEMRDAGDFLVPRLHGDAYLAKPPLVYWLTNALWTITGASSPVIPLRLVSGLAGAATITLTFALFRALPLAARTRPRALSAQTPDAPHAAPVSLADAPYFAALCLTPLSLLVYQARSGEIDVLTAPATVLGLWAAARAVTRHAARRILYQLTLVAAFAWLTLAKGPPGGLVLLATLLAWPLIDAARRTPRPPSGRASSRVAPAHPHAPLLRRPPVIAAAASAVTIAALFFILRRSDARPPDARDLAGIALAATLAAALAACIARTLSHRCRRTLFVARLRAVRPLLAAAIGTLPFVAWSVLAGRAARDVTPSGIGGLGNSTDIAQVAAKQAAENLVIFVPSAPAEYAEAALYAAGPGSIAALAALIWFIKDRPRLSHTALIPLAWTLAPILVFGLAGRGTARYITAAWPGVALLGGLWIAALRADHPRTGRLVTSGLTALAVIATAALAWALSPSDPAGLVRAANLRSCRPMLRAIAKSHPDAAVATLDMWDPCVDVHAAEANLRMLGHHTSGAGRGGTLPAKQLAASAHASPLIVLISTNADPSTNTTADSPLDRLSRALNLPPTALTPLDTPEWSVRDGDERVIAVRIAAP